MLSSMLKKSSSVDNLEDGPRSPRRGHIRSPSNESIEEWTKQRQSEKVSVTWKVSKFSLGAVFRAPDRLRPPLPCFPLQDLVVSVKPTGKVLLNKVTGNISNGFYAIMVG